MNELYYQHKYGGFYQMLEASESVVVYSHLWPFNKSVQERPATEFFNSFRQVGGASLVRAMSPHTNDHRKAAQEAITKRKSNKTPLWDVAPLPVPPPPPPPPPPLSPDALAKSLYALAETFAVTRVLMPKYMHLCREARVGDMVMVSMTRTINPIRQIGKLVADEWVLIPSWGPVETWHPSDQEEYRQGKRVGQQREWEILCLDGELKRWTDVQIILLPPINEV